MSHDPSVAIYEAVYKQTPPSQPKYTRCGCAKLSSIPPAVLGVGQAQKGGESTSIMKQHLHEECEDAPAKAYLLPVVLEYRLVQQGRKADTHSDFFNLLDPFASRIEKQSEIEIERLNRKRFCGCEGLPPTSRA